MGSSDSDSVFPSKEETGETNSELMWLTRRFKSGKYSKHSWVGFKVIQFLQVGFARSWACILQDHARSGITFKIEEANVLRNTEGQGSGLH